MIQSSKNAQKRTKHQKPLIFKQKKAFILNKIKPRLYGQGLKTQPKQIRGSFSPKLQKHSSVHTMERNDLGRPRTSKQRLDQQLKNLKIDHKLQKLEFKLHQIKSKIDSGLKGSVVISFKARSSPKFKGDSFDRIFQKLTKKTVTPAVVSCKQQIYYVSGVVKTFLQEESLPKFREHINFTLNILQRIKTIKKPTDKLAHLKQLQLSRHPYHLGRKTIVFDLDQTLVHCNSDLLCPAHFRIRIRFPDNQQEFVQAGINVRPYAVQCLKKLSTKFQLILFTASFSCYAQKVLQILDPQKTIFAHRLFRQHCFQRQGVFIKDLRIINRQLSQMVLVDNAAYSYHFQPQNGVPIIPFFDEQSDDQLLELTSFCEHYLTCQDVRDVNRRFFKLQKYRFYESGDELAYRLYGDWNE